jgi:hypothetical protein
MPFAMCPVCGAVFHLNVVDREKWYQDHHPSVPAGELVPARCFDCWQELEKGDPVVVCNLSPGRAKANSGDQGVIQAVFSSDAEGIYLVKLVSGAEIYLIRAQLRKPRGTELQAKNTQSGH